MTESSSILQRYISKGYLLFCGDFKEFDVLLDCAIQLNVVVDTWGIYERGAEKSVIPVKDDCSLVLLRFLLRS